MQVSVGPEGNHHDGGGALIGALGVGGHPPLPSVPPVAAPSAAAAPVAAAAPATTRLPSNGASAPFPAAQGSGDDILAQALGDLNEFLDAGGDLGGDLDLHLRQGIPGNGLNHLGHGGHVGDGLGDLFQLLEPLGPAGGGHGDAVNAGPDGDHTEGAAAGDGDHADGAAAAAAAGVGDHAVGAAAAADDDHTDIGDSAGGAGGSGLSRAAAAGGGGSNGCDASVASAATATVYPGGVFTDGFTRGHDLGGLSDSGLNSHGGGDLDSQGAQGGGAAQEAQVKNLC